MTSRHPDLVAELAELEKQLAEANRCIEEMHAVIDRKNAIIHLMSFGDCEQSSEVG